MGFTSKGPSLPKDLLDKLGLQGTSHKKGKRLYPKGRKELRKVARDQNRKHKPQPPHVQRGRSLAVQNDESSGDEDETSELEAAQKVENSSHRSAKRVKLSQDVHPLPKKRSAALLQDDMEIAYLEKKLGIKGKKKSKAMQEDGLDELLQDIDDAMVDEDDLQDQEWLKRKRKAYEEESEDENEDDMFSLEAEGDSEAEDEEDLDIFDDEMEDNDDGEDEGVEEDFDSDEAQEDIPRVKENPYRPPVEASQKYIPPSLREPTKDDQELLVRLRRQLQGLLNRLTESNILSIVKDVDRIFNENPRQQTITCLIDILMSLICDRTTLMDTFLILHAAFVSAMYKTHGAHFGAQFLERFVSDFTTFYTQEPQNPAGSKETANLISLLADLYSFQMINNHIMFDYIKLLSAELTDLNAELLLRLIKSCGPQLRADNPSALKDVVILVQRAISLKGETKLPVRTKFMVETIMDLKNNKTKNLGSQLATETIVRMKKTLAGLNSRSLKGTEPLGIGLRDIEQANKGGKWWLVGASWSNAPREATGDVNGHDGADSANGGHTTMEEETILADEPTSAELAQLAKEHRMNTDIRRAIFTTVLSAADFKDCYLRLRRIGLNKKQQLEIPRILVYCTTIEEAYNPYYRLIAEQMCDEHRFRKAFEFNLWNTVRKLGENPDMDSDLEDDEEDGNDISITEVVNIGKMYGEMIASMSLPITILKILNFMYLQPKTKTLVEVLLVSMFQCLDKRAKSESTHDQQVMDIFSKAKEAPQLTTGLRYFLPTVVKSSSLVTSSKHKKALKKNCRLAMDVLAVIHTATAS